MLREIKGYLYTDPEDILNDPYIILDTDANHNLIFYEKWGSIKHFRKHELSYLTHLLQLASNGSLNGLNECDVVLLVLITSRVYSSVSKRYKYKKQSFYTHFFVRDIFNDALIIFLELLKQGKSKQEIFTWKSEGNKKRNIIEELLIKKYLTFLLEQKSHEENFSQLSEQLF